MSERQQRQGFRLSVKKAVDTVKQLKVQPQTPETVDQLIRKGITLTTYLNKLEVYDRAVFSKITEETELDQEITSTRLFNETVEQAIEDAQHVPSPIARPSVPQGIDSTDQSLISKPVKVSLPKLEIPPFSGDPLQWQEFWDAFKAAIHDRNDLATINKFTYLRGLLEGEALRVIEGFRVTEANYKDVVELLSQRYGDKQSVVFAHIDALLSLRPSSGEVASLVSMHTTLERHLRSLESLQPDPDMILHSVILSKLPRFLKVEAHRRKMSQPAWSLENLRQWLKDEIRAREMADRLHRLNSSASGVAESSFKEGGVPRGDRIKPAKGGNSSASALVTQSKEVPCQFCCGSHRAEDCAIYPDAQSRRAQLNDRCFACLRKGHMAKNCRARQPCKFCESKGHHSSFCFKFGKLKQTATNSNRSQPQSVPSGAGKVSPRDTKPTEDSSDSSVLLASNNKREQTIMQTAIVHVVNDNGRPTVQARLFFDTGASRSFITEAKQRELKLPVKRRELLSVSSFQSLKRQTSEHKMVEFGVKCRDGSIQPVSAAVVPTITCPILKVPLDPQLVAVPDWSLAEPLCQSSQYVTVDILVGMDYYYSFASSQRVQGGENLWFLSSRVGFLASGRVPSSESGAETVSVMLLDSFSAPTATDPPLIDLSKYWDLEEIGFKENPKEASADEEAIASFSSTVQFKDDRYQVQWPWKSPSQELQPNYGLALGRLKSLLARLQKTPHVMQLYSEVIQSQLETGVIEQASPVSNSKRVYYVPHHCVAKPDHSTTKLRVVFDASSKVSKNASSLNECLHRGPVLLEDLCGLLLRFRTFPVALVSDIEKAFLQIGLQESERDVTRFLWVRDADRPPAGDNLVVFRFCRVPFGVISSPFLLAATVSHHLKISGSPVAGQILRDLYVDNVITGAESSNDAIEFYHSAKLLLSQASMNLREWHSNSDTVLAAIPDADRGNPVEPKVLGLKWHTKKDTLRLTGIKVIDDSPTVTKRGILKTLAQLFDPCGYAAPVVVSGKILLQDLWAKKIGWDDPVPAELLRVWRDKIMPSLASISQFSLPRHLGTSLAGEYQLHAFCDASSRACAAAVYIRSEVCSQAGIVNLMMSKSRLAPISQKTTTPRLELIAVVLGTRLLEFVAKQLSLPVTSRYVWTDSQCVLHWLRKEQVRTRFVQNRVNELRKLTDVDFRYAPTAENPADLPTRGCSTEALINSQLWWHGPSWLSDADSHWPTICLPAPKDTQPETVPVPVLETDEVPSCVRIIDETRYSTIQRLLKVTAYVLRFIHNVRVSHALRRKGYLLVEEVASARTWWLKLIQQQHFESFFNTKPDISVKQGQSLGVFVDSAGLLRCSGRIQAANISYNATHPLLLPKSGHFVDLLIQHTHNQVMHAGLASTLARLREHFWVIHGRIAVKRVLRNCRVCRRFDGGPYKTPAVPPLPALRLEQKAAFTNTGLDYLGPLFVHPEEEQEPQKVWILLFTCAVTRAIHLEVTTDMSTEQLMLALRRFIALHGAPALLLSDNGRQFCTAARVFTKWWQELRESEAFRAMSLARNIDWRFIPEMAPWMGGFYERLVAVVKQALRKSLYGVRATLSQLQTLIAEIIAVVNSRPLVYIEDEVGSYTLSPTHLIAPLRRDGYVFSPSYGDDYMPPPSIEQLTAHWKRLQGLAENFWRSWRSQYLLSLRERHSSHGQRGVSPWLPAVGAVVQLKQDAPRATWRLGRIESLTTSADGLVRSANIRLSNGRTVRRPMKLIYPLELDVSTPTDRQGAPNDTTTPRRPTRAAAVQARKAWRQQQIVVSDEE